MAVRRIITIDDPEGLSTLRAYSMPVDPAEMRLIFDLIKDLRDTVKSIKMAVGLSTIQFGHCLQMCYWGSWPGFWNPNAPKIKNTLAINPVIVEHSEDEVLGYENCLCSGLVAIVPRWRRVLASYTTFGILNFKRVEHWLEGLPARVFQHECDHQNGVLFLDRALAIMPLAHFRELNKQRSRLLSFDEFREEAAKLSLQKPY